MIIDAIVLGLAYIIPALSHLFSLPIYYLDPMKILLFLGWILSRNHYNAMFMAVTIPLFSMWVTGHPTLVKSTLISLELTVMMLVFLWLFRQKISVWISVFLSIVCSKIIYYLLKYVWLSVGWLDGNLISTPLGAQLGITILLTIIAGSMLYAQQKRSNG